MAMGFSTTTAQGPTYCPSFVFSRSRPCRRFLVGSSSPSSTRSFWASRRALRRDEVGRKDDASYAFPISSSTGPARLKSSLFSPPSGEYVNNCEELAYRAAEHSRRPQIPDHTLQVIVNMRSSDARMIACQMSQNAAAGITSPPDSSRTWKTEAERIRESKDEICSNYMQRENSSSAPRTGETPGTGNSRNYKPNGFGLQHTQRTHGETLRKFDKFNDFISPPGIELDMQKIMHFESKEALVVGAPLIETDQIQMKSQQSTKTAENITTVRSSSDGSGYKFSPKAAPTSKSGYARKQVYRRVQNAQPPRATSKTYGRPVVDARKTVEETPKKSSQHNVVVPSPERLVGTSVLVSEPFEDEAVVAFGVDAAKDKASNTSEDVRKKLRGIYEEVIVVDNISMAREIVQKLTHQYRHLIHACDTEVAKIDVKQETPVDHGEVICFSIYSGPEADYGNGKSCVWVDVLDGGGNDLLLEFAPFFEDPKIKKVWHNYSFDNHVLENYGIKLSGFHADTMHMARLWNSSRRTEGGYSLEALTGDREVMSGAALGPEKELIGKISMKTIFGKKKVKKDGSEGKITTLAPVEELQREEQELWISYSSLDAISTLKLYESLRNKLLGMAWRFNGMPQAGKSMFDFYKEYWRPFGEILVKMERDGMLVDRPYLADIEKLAKAEQEVAVNRFRNWASKYCPDAKYMNVGSDTQLRQLFFGGILNSKDPNEALPEEKTFKITNDDGFIEEGKKKASKYRNITLRSIGVKFPTEMYTATGWPSVSGPALKTLAGKVSAEYDLIDEASEVEQLEESNEEIISESKMEGVVSKKVDISQYGTAYGAFLGDEEAGKAACHAIAALCEVCSIDSLISNFILPLQGCNVSGKDGRVHCSLNINTETGRLSARRPNLQNQPALEKDRYKIRQAFIAAPGNSLIVADYGQLELRILAHLANCKSMLDAFKAGGDFHSRTALNMYDHIREAVENEEVLLEWHPQPGEDKPPVPLLKDAFGSERRKAKMLNFSIAYGKTPMGLARDWKVSVEEARKTVDLWYKERQEVLVWQEKRKQEAREHGQVYTLLGRARRFPSFSRASYAQKGHIERAAINTPVQGSAADVAMSAMLQIFKNERLKELGWKLLLQVHDEVILEGPSESAEEAKAIVVDCMSKPFFEGENILTVDLSVDAKCAQNWYAAK
ncbi:DNA polymerase I B, chloroplastic/mitochondrial-like [Punica granatum]|uniref:DNA-directed DNA polymerase n=2 Tax=Punica granatum TaxID=22663 RepID=A0A6P8EE16_PUNGR|nr:DNA polymerase I B, chloroplastic/mitochondrial-like [Punica granatum]